MDFVQRRKVGWIGFRGEGWDELGSEKKSRMNHVIGEVRMDWVKRRRVEQIDLRGEGRMDWVQKIRSE